MQSPNTGHQWSPNTGHQTPSHTAPHPTQTETCTNSQRYSECTNKCTDPKLEQESFHFLATTHTYGTQKW
jgi:hypothetical protein